MASEVGSWAERRPDLYSVDIESSSSGWKDRLSSNSVRWNLLSTPPWTLTRVFRAFGLPVESGFWLLCILWIVTRKNCQCLKLFLLLMLKGLCWLLECWSWLQEQSREEPKHWLECCDGCGPVLWFCFYVLLDNSQLDTLRRTTEALRPSGPEPASLL